MCWFVLVLRQTAKPKSKKKARPLAPVLETEHEAVSGVSEQPSEETAIVVSARGTLDEDDDDFFA